MVATHHFENARASMGVDHAGAKAWLVMVTMTASCQKVFHPNPRIGFLAQ